jgi:hypothetical protein
LRLCFCSLADAFALTCGRVAAPAACAFACERSRRAMAIATLGDPASASSISASSCESP